MNTTSYFMRVTALNPISHIGKTASTGALFNTETVDGKEVPYITGASGKGVLRRVGMDVMLSMLDLDPEQYDKELIKDKQNPLTQNRLEVLFNGSILSRTGTRAIKIDTGALLAELIPWFAVVGGCLGNTMMQGRISVHPMTLICEENQERLSVMEQSINRRISGKEGIAIIDSNEIVPARRRLQRQEFSHKDDFNTLGSSAMRFLPTQEKKVLTDGKAVEYLDKQDPDWQDEGSHVQMRFSKQTLTAMSQFYWQIDTFDLTPLMEDAFITTMSYFLSRPYIGGDRRQGMGYIDLEFLGRSRVEPAKADLTTSVQSKDFKMGDLYRTHLQTRQTEIIEALEVIAAK